MTDRDLIERLAREAEIDPPDAHEGGVFLRWGASTEDLGRFVALVAEECAKECEQMAATSPDGDTDRDALLAGAAAIRAKFCPPRNDYILTANADGAMHVAARNRATGEVTSCDPAPRQDECDNDAPTMVAMYGQEHAHVRYTVLGGDDEPEAAPPDVADAIAKRLEEIGVRVVSCKSVDNGAESK